LTSNTASKNNLQTLLLGRDAPKCKRFFVSSSTSPPPPSNTQIKDYENDGNDHYLKQILELEQEKTNLFQSKSDYLEDDGSGELQKNVVPNEVNNDLFRKQMLELEAERTNQFGQSDLDSGEFHDQKDDNNIDVSSSSSSSSSSRGEIEDPPRPPPLTANDVLDRNEDRDAQYAFSEEEVSAWGKIRTSSSSSATRFHSHKPEFMNVIHASRKAKKLREEEQRQQLEEELIKQHTTMVGSEQPTQAKKMWEEIQQQEERMDSSMVVSESPGNDNNNSTILKQPTQANKMREEIQQQEERMEPTTMVVSESLGDDDNNNTNHTLKQPNNESSLNTIDDDAHPNNNAVLTHLSKRGDAVSMVDVGYKNITRRSARARSIVVFPPEVMKALGLKEDDEKGENVINNNNNLSEVIGPKGPIIATARIAGIMGAKQTSTLIPLCHPLPLEKVHIDISLKGNKAIIECECHVTHKTGVEMEALVGASIAALTIYDMLKAVSHNVIIGKTELISKTGGKRDYDSDDDGNGS